MSRQISPFAALTGAEKQIRWLEYQSIRLPYVQVEDENNTAPSETVQTAKPAEPDPKPRQERPQPPPEVPRSMPNPAEFQKTRHSQYDAVIARLKQAELQSRRMPN